MKENLPTKILEAGTIIGDFSILRLLGTGGMGVVYLAEQKSLKRKVAIKFISSTESSKSLDRLLREAQLSAQLNHPNIVKTYMVAEENGVHYLVISYIEGETLKKYIETKNPSLEGTLGIFKTITEAVGYAHKNGVIHRDLKPANIMVKQDGTPFVLDFGLAKSHRFRDKSLTKTGEVLGTLQYMSPEQAQGEKNLDERTDIYSLGAILYEIVVGKVMFDRESSLQLLNQVIHELPILPRSINPKIPSPLEAIILKSVEKERRRRYATAEEMAKDIERYLNGEEVLASGEHSMRRLKYRFMSHKKGILYTALCMMIIATLVLGYAFFTRRSAIADNVLLSPAEQIQETMARETEEKPSLEKYDSYIQFLIKEGSYGLAVQKCDKAIEWAQNAGLEQGIISLQKTKADLLFESGQYQSSYKLYKELSGRLQKSKDSSIDSILFRIAECSFELRQYPEIVQIWESWENKSKISQDFSFYLSASLFEQFLTSIPKCEYIDRICQTSSENLSESQNRILQDSINLLRDAENICKDKKWEKLLPIYLGYALLWQKKWDEAEKYLPKNPSLSIQDEHKVMLYEALGILAFSKQDYKQAIDFFSHCIALTPWDSSYYFYRAKAYLEQPDRPAEEFLDNCFHAIHLSPSNLSPFSILLDDMTKNQKQDEIFYSIKFMMDSFEKLLRQMEPNLWDREYKKMARFYIQENRSIPSSKIFSSNTLDSLIKKAKETQSQNGFDMVRDILAGMWHQENVLKLLEQEKKQCLQNVQKGSKKAKFEAERISNILSLIESKRKQYAIQKMRASLARFIVSKALIEEEITSESIALLEEILKNTNEPVLLRYWAAEMMMFSRLPETYQVLQQGCLSGDMITKALCISALSHAGFKISSEVMADFFFYLKDLDSDALAIFLHNAGEHIPMETAVSMLGHQDAKVRACASKAILRQGNEQGIPDLISGFSSDNENLRAYSYWWLLHDGYDSFEKNYPKLLTKDILEKIKTALNNEANAMVKQIIVQSIGDLPLIVLKTEKESIDELCNALRQILARETNEMVRLHILMAFVKTGCIKDVLEHAMDSKEKFIVRSFPLLSMYTYSTYFMDSSTKLISHFKDIAKLMRYPFWQDPDIRLRKVYFFFIAAVSSSNLLQSMKDMLCFNPLKEALSSPDESTRILAAYVSSVSLDDSGKLRRLLIQKFGEEKSEKVKKYQASGIAYLSYLAQIQDNQWLKKCQQEYPESLAYAHYHAIEVNYHSFIEERLWNSTTFWKREQRYFLHANSLVHPFPGIQTFLARYPYSLLKEWEERTGHEALSFKILLQECKTIIERKFPSQNWLSIQSISPNTFTYQEFDTLRRVLMTADILNNVYHCHEAWRYNPKNPRYSYEMHILLEKVGEYEKAQTNLNYAIQLNPDRAIYKMSQASLFLRQGKYEEALRQIEGINSRRFNSYILLGLKGNIYLQNRQWDKAMECFTRQYIMQPSMPESLVSMAHAELWQKKNKSAKQKLQEALAQIKKDQAKICSFNHVTEEQLWDTSIQRIIIYRFAGFTEFIRAKGNYHLGMARLAALENDTERAIQELKQGTIVFFVHTLSHPYSPFSKEKLREYPEFASLMSHPFVQSLPEKIIGFSTVK